VRDLPASALETITPSLITLNELTKYSADLLAGKVRGRLIVDVRA
jgi:hypothetical protein